MRRVPIIVKLEGTNLVCDPRETEVDGGDIVFWPNQTDGRIEFEFPAAFEPTKFVADRGGRSNDGAVIRRLPRGRKFSPKRQALFNGQPVSFVGDIIIRDPDPAP